MCTVIESEPVIGCGIWHVCIAIDDDMYVCVLLVVEYQCRSQSKEMIILLSFLSNYFGTGFTFL